MKRLDLPSLQFMNRALAGLLFLMGCSVSTAQDRCSTGIGKSNVAIGQFVDRQFFSTDLKGKTLEASVDSPLLTASSFGPDGRHLVGSTGTGIVVLDSELRPIWTHTLKGLNNVISLALSPDTSKVAVLAMDAEDRYGGIWLLGQDQSERLLYGFRYELPRDRAAALAGIRKDSAWFLAWNLKFGS